MGDAPEWQAVEDGKVIESRFGISGERYLRRRYRKDPSSRVQVMLAPESGDGPGDWHDE